MNHPLTEAIGLHIVVQLAMDFENEVLVNPMECEKTATFRWDVLSLLRKHNITAADLSRPTIGDGIWTVLQYLRGNPEMPWNVLVLLRDWDSRYRSTGVDIVADWIDAQEFRGC
uniref:Uncharacterized protein n=1 Tax=Leviviridae sp. TaxID=2027243 RepID=A0A514D2T8_9VIRU|nr:MAG: hypothetical protein H2Rhizo33298e3776_000002 [Leviviridae sp.]